MADGSGGEALFIVHLSSLDSYTDARGSDAGEALGFELEEMIAAWDGLIFVTDQGWEYTRCSQPRRGVLRELEGHGRVRHFAHDEDTGDWDEAIARLGDLLRGCGVTSLVLGGVWATRDGSAGCVNETQRLLEGQGFRCRLDYSICGLEEEGEGDE